MSRQYKIDAESLQALEIAMSNAFARGNSIELKKENNRLVVVELRRKMKEKLPLNMKTVNRD